jgi:hypothetical protein
MTASHDGPPTQVRFAALARILGVALLLGGLVIGAGTEYQIRDQSRWARDLIASPPRAGDAAVQAKAHYHLSRVEEQRRTRWSLFGHGTWAVLFVGSGAALLWRGTRRRPT